MTAYCDIIFERIDKAILLVVQLHTILPDSDDRILRHDSNMISAERPWRRWSWCDGISWIKPSCVFAQHAADGVSGRLHRLKAKLNQRRGSTIASRLSSVGVGV